MTSNKWEDCPGKKRKLIDRGRDVVKPFTTRIKCIECTFNFNSNTYFCNDYSRGGQIQQCHDLYHRRYHCKDVDDEIIGANNINTGQSLSSVSQYLN